MTHGRRYNQNHINAVVCEDGAVTEICHYRGILDLALLTTVTKGHIISLILYFFLGEIKIR